MTPGLRGLPALIAVATISTAPACRRDEPEVATQARIHLLEIVTHDVDAVVELHRQVHGLCFGPPDADLGRARVATRADGTLVAIREPLAAHETPIMRTYLEVDDIEAAVEKAEAAGATTAYPPTLQDGRGTFAIVFSGDVQHGLWQR